jgi:hypothetical protein
LIAITGRYCAQTQANVSSCSYGIILARYVDMSQY